MPTTGTGKRKGWWQVVVAIAILMGIAGAIVFGFSRLADPITLAEEPILRDDLEVRVISAEIATPENKEIFGGAITNEKPLLLIRFDVSNMSTEGPRVFTPMPPPPQVVDDLGDRYALIGWTQMPTRFAGFVTDGPTEVPPGLTLPFVAAFDLPTPTAKSLILSIPGTIVSGPGGKSSADTSPFRFRISVEKIRHDGATSPAQRETAAECVGGLRRRSSGRAAFADQGRFLALGIGTGS